MTSVARLNPARMTVLPFLSGVYAIPTRGAIPPVMLEFGARKSTSQLPSTALSQFPGKGPACHWGRFGVRSKSSADLDVVDDESVHWAV